MIRILSHLRIFELKKVSHLRILTRDQYFEQKLRRNWIVRTLSHLNMPSCDMTSFDVFLSHLKIPPVPRFMFWVAEPNKSIFGPLHAKLQVKQTVFKFKGELWGSFENLTSSDEAHLPTGKAEIPL